MINPELWLLTAAVESFCPLSWLISDTLEAVFNRPGHGLCRDALITTLLELFNRGDIVAEQSMDGARGHPFCPSHSAIERAFDTTMDLDYGLTPQGGRYWESLVHPSWQRFWTFATYPESEVSWLREIVGADAIRTEHAFELLHVYEAFVPASLKREELRPWQATYWKSLPTGYRVTYQYVPESDNDSAIIKPAWVEAHLRNLKQWYS